MKPSKAELNEIIEESIEILKENDIYLFEVDAHERSITHKLGMYIQKKLKAKMILEYNVDCEYNRNICDKKKLKAFGKNSNNIIRVYPDIIVHKRGELDNLLAIEVKKKCNEMKKNKDIEKLKKYVDKNELGYEFGLYIEFGIENEKGYSLKWIN